MQHEQASGINFFQRYLTVWVLLCMIVGVALYLYPLVPCTFMFLFFLNAIYKPPS